MDTACKGLVAIYPSHIQAEAAVKELQRSNFDMKNLSIVGRDYHTEEKVVGYYNTGERMKYWGKLGAFWGGIWSLLFGSAVFFIPGIGPFVAAGPIVGWIVGALEGAAVVGGVSAIGAGLFSLGVPKDSVMIYDTALTAGKFIVIVHGTDQDVVRARDLLKSSSSEPFGMHDLAPAAKLAAAKA